MTQLDSNKKISMLNINNSSYFIHVNESLKILETLMYLTGLYIFVPKVEPRLQISSV